MTASEPILRDDVSESERHAAQREYDPADDFRRSLDVGYARIRERMAGGGKGWEP